MSSRRARCRRTGWLAAAILLAVAGCTATGQSSPTPASGSRSAPAGPSTLSSAVVRPPEAGSTAATNGTPSSPITVATPSSPSAPSAPSATGTTPSTVTTGGTCVAGFCYRPGAIYQLPAGVAPESSGIAASATMPGAFYVVDDSTGTGEIVAVRSDGSLVARIGITGMSARNAEAVSAGPCGSRAGRCLYVGDIGDNAAQRKIISVYRVDEPGLATPPQAPLRSDRWRYTYPDGPHNAEAMVVLADGSLLILTKSAPDAATGQVPPHRIYRAPAGGGVLTFVSTYRPPDPTVAVQSLFTGTVVTDASYTAGRMLLLTYDEVVEYRAPSPGADPATFPSWPHAALPAPAMIQSEGITADLTGCGYEVTSEEGPDGSRAGLAGVACS